MIGISQQLLIVQWEFFATTKSQYWWRKECNGDLLSGCIARLLMKKHAGGGGGEGGEEERRGEQMGLRKEKDDDFWEDSVLGRFIIHVPGHNVCEMYVCTCPVC